MGVLEDIEAVIETGRKLVTGETTLDALCEAACGTKKQEEETKNEEKKEPPPETVKPASAPLGTLASVTPIR